MKTARELRAEYYKNECLTRCPVFKNPKKECPFFGKADSCANYKAKLSDVEQSLNF